MSWSKISDLEICGGRLQRLSNAIVFREKETKYPSALKQPQEKKLLMVHGADDPPDSSSDS